MKNILLLVLSFYQKIFSPLLHQLLGVKTVVCRSSPSCSVYAQQVIEKHGIGKGSLLALQRLINCQPFFTVRFKTNVPV